MKSLHTRNLSYGSKLANRGNWVQPAVENPQIMRTPPHRSSSKMLVENLAPTRRQPHVPDSRNIITQARMQAEDSQNKENEIPIRNNLSQKLPALVRPHQIPESSAEEQNSMEDTRFDAMDGHSGAMDDALKAKEDLNYFEVVVEPIEIQLGPCLDLDLLLEVDYGQVIEDDMFMNQPDFSNCLAHTEIRKTMRAKMLDWMIEVLSHYWQTTSHQTFFLSAAIMDLYCKYTPRVTIKRKLKDSDVHIIGITAMFLASKYDDVYHIPLVDFVERVGHGKFSSDEIKSAECEILKVLEYNISFPTVLNYLERLIYKNFHEDGCNMLKNIKDATIHILKMCLYDYPFLNYKPLILALAVLCYCIKCYFFSLTEENMKNGNPVNLTEQENCLLQSILKGCTKAQIIEVENCMHKVNELTHDFEKRYPNMQNLRKFSEVQTK